jgi:hypothetical protein
VVDVEIGVTDIVYWTCARCAEVEVSESEAPPAGWIRDGERVRHAVCPPCDCGHPVSYHHNGRCGWCPGKSRLHCACTAVTQTGVARDDRFTK